MTQNFSVEVMDSSNAWQDYIADTKHISISSLGLVGQRYAYPQTGRCVLTMNNQSGNYGPTISGVGSGRVDNRRRVRVRTTGSGLGKELQATLTGTGAVGGTVDTSTDLSSFFIGGVTTLRLAQSFQVTGAGVLTQFVYNVRSNTSAGYTPVLNYEFHNYDATQPGSIGKTVLASGTNTFGAAGTHTVSIASGPYLYPNTTYWLLVWVGNYLTGVLDLNSSSVDNYANGSLWVSADSGVTWTVATVTYARFDLQITVTTASVVVYWSQVVTTGTSVSDVWNLQWDARAAYDSQLNSDSVNIVTSSDTGAATNYNYTNKWKTYTLSFTALHTATTVAPRFAPQYVGNGFSSSAIEYRNITLKKGAGADVLTNGNFATGSSSPWTVTNSGGNTLSLVVANDYRVVYQGFIEKIQSTHGKFGDLQSIITCVDWVEILKLQNILPTLQENVTASQLISYVLAFLTPLTFNATIPGSLLATGKNVISEALDGITQNTLSIMQVMTDACISEYGRWYVDRDGTIRFRNRDFIPYFQQVATSLTLADGQPWAASDGEPQRDIATIINSVTLTYHPRNTTAAPTALGNAAAGGAIQIPGIHPDGSPGQTTVTITYRDATTSKYIGGKSITAITATTDYLINDRSDGTGFNYTNTASFSITNITYGATQTTLTLNNTATGPLFATLLQVRGIPVTHYDPVQFKLTDATSISDYQERTYVKDLPYANDQSFATSFSDYLIKQYKYPFAQFGGVKIVEKDTINSVDLMSLELFDIVSVASSQPNLAAIKHFITGINYEIDPTSANAVQSVEFNLEKYDFNTFFILGDATYGQLGVAGNGLYM